MKVFFLLLSFALALLFLGQTQATATDLDDLFKDDPPALKRADRPRKPPVDLHGYPLKPPVVDCGTPAPFPPPPPHSIKQPPPTIWEKIKWTWRKLFPLPPLQIQRFAQ